MSALLEIAAAWTAWTESARMAWLGWMGPALWRGTVALVVAATVDLLLRRRVWPQVLSALWAVAFAQHLLPPGLESPLGLFSATGPTAAGAMAGGAGGASTVSPAGGSILLPLIWLVGAVALAVRGRRRRRRHLQRLRAGRTVPGERLRRLYARALDRVRRRRAGLLRWLPEPRLLVSETAEAPAAIGVRSPEIVVPASLEDRLRDRELEHVLVHELAHVRRGDLLVQALFAGVHLLFWFQPLLIWGRRRAHACRELCCDATVVSLLEGGAGAYRTTLLRVALGSDGGGTPETVGLLGGVVVHRVEWLEPGRDAGPAARLAGLGILLLLSALFLPGSSSPGDTPDGVALAEARRQVEVALEGGSSMRLRQAVMKLHSLEQARSGESSGIAPSEDRSRGRSKH